MAKGFIFLDRKLMDNWVWQSPDYGFAWVDLLMLANHKSEKVLIDNELIEVKRGEHITSIGKLASRWKCTRSKARTILDNFEKDGMLARRSNNRYTHLTIVNYCVYQQSTHKPIPTVESTVRPTPVSTVRPTVRPQTINDKEMNKNEKERKEPALQPNPFGFDWE